jgi:hypothetical protein
MENPSYLLTDTECDRFAWWLTQEAKTTKGMVQKFKELNLPSTFIASQETYIAACLVLLNKLQTTESMTIKG